MVTETRAQALEQEGTDQAKEKNKKQQNNHCYEGCDGSSSYHSFVRKRVL